MITLAAFALAGCLAVDSASDGIRAGDLSPGFPEMARLEAALVMAPAPAPGVVRVFHPAELRRLAAVHGLTSLPQNDICVARPVAGLDPQHLLAAMHHEFPGGHIELLEFSRQPAPDGPIEFPKSGLRAGPTDSAAGALWTGWVRYGTAHRFSIWARVKITVRVKRILALTDLPTGQPIAAAQVEVSPLDEIPAAWPAATAFAESLDEVIGQWPRQNIRAGEPIRRAWLQVPQAVRNGETVKVAVRDGGAHVELEARAEGSGAVGEIIFVRNPNSHRRFRARVEGTGRVAVDAAGTEALELHP